jgi:hypothetical protein
MTDEPVYPKLVPPVDGSCSASPNSGTSDAGASHTRGNLPWVRPVIETLPQREGPPPNVIREWSGESPLDPQGAHDGINQDTE